MRQKPEPNTLQEGGHYLGGFFPSPQELDAIRTFPRVYEKQLQDVHYRESTAAGCGVVLIVVSSSRRLMAKVPSALLLPS